MSEKYEKIELTLNPAVEEQTQIEPEKPEVKAEEKVVIHDPYKEIELSDAEKKQLEEFSKTIDVMETQTILQYGASAQRKITDFSDNALKNVRTKDLGEIGDAITHLVGELRGFEQEDKKGGIFGFFKKKANQILNYKTKYDEALKNVEKISDVLEEHQIQLLKDIALLDQLYDRNQVNIKELSMYIISGRLRLKEIREKQLVELIEKAKQSNRPEDAQAANDLSNACDRFEKKLHDLELTRQVAVQMAPQIRLIQNNDTLMTEKIQSTLVNTIPLWKNQIVLALGLTHAKEAMEAQREVSNITNELLKKNAEMLHQSTIETAKENERGIVDIETLKLTNEKLITTLNEVMTIQKDGREKRRVAEEELLKIESRLSAKLLEIDQENKAVKTQ